MKSENRLNFCKGIHWLFMSNTQKKKNGSVFQMIVTAKKEQVLALELQRKARIN